MIDLRLKSKAIEKETVRALCLGHLSDCEFMKHKELMNNEKEEKKRRSKQTKNPQ